MRFAALFFSLFLFFSAFLLAPVRRAEASGVFNTEERYILIQEVDIRGTTGEALLLGRKIKIHSLILPYAADDEGYVLFSADLSGYKSYPLDEVKLKSLQAKKLLPDPLPPFHMSAALYLELHSLWLPVAALGALALIVLYSRKRSILNLFYATRGDWRSVVDSDVEQMLKRIRKLKQMHPASNGQELARVRARTGYSDYALWLLALDGFLLMGFRGDAFSLDRGMTSPEDKDAQRQSLIEGWGVASRQDLINMLSDVRRGMHTHEYNYYLDVWRGPQDELKKSMKEDRNVRKQLQLIGGTTDVVEARSLLAWDYGRGILLTCRGYALGYLSEQEAWSYLKYFGDEIGKRYSSWQDYGLNFLIGRVFWAEDKMAYFDETEDSLRWLFSREGAWAVPPWPKAGKARAAA